MLADDADGLEAMDTPTTSAIHAARTETEEMIAKHGEEQGNHPPFMLVPLTPGAKTAKDRRVVVAQRMRRALITLGCIMIAFGAVLVAFGPWGEEWPHLYWQRSQKCRAERDECKAEKTPPRTCDASMDCDSDEVHQNNTRWSLKFPDGCCRFEEYFRGKEGPSCYSTPACQTFLPATIGGGVLLMAGLLSVAMARRPPAKLSRRKSRLKPHGFSSSGGSMPNI
jgi:hypothetical protein